MYMIYILEEGLKGNKLLQLVVIAVVIDTIFGCLRAMKERKFNSNFGINGAIRKIAMLISIMAAVIIDAVVEINLVGFIPLDIRTYLPTEKVGIMEFFAVLYVIYEACSILKNMSLCGLPVKNLWKASRKLLQKYTDELPGNDIADEEIDSGKE